MQRANADLTPKSGGASSRSLVGLAAATFTATGSVLLLLGYGVALSANDFLTHYGTTSSPFDFLQLSFLAVGYMASRMLQLSVTQIVELRPLPLYGATFLAMFCVFLALRYSYRSASKHHAGLQVQLRIKRFFFPAGSPSVGDAMARAAVGSFAATALSAAVTAAIGLALYLGLYLMIVVVAILPMLGETAGREYIKDYVVTPTSCKPVRSRESRLSSEPSPERPQASCVAVCKDSTLRGFGRVVFGNASTLVLYEPDTGAAARVPVADATVLAVDNLRSVDADTCRVDTHATRRSAQGSELASMATQRGDAESVSSGGTLRGEER
jgi:hypothetical protein